MTKRALIVDDEPDIRELLEITLGRMDIETKAAKDVRSATELLGYASLRPVPDGHAFAGRRRHRIGPPHQLGASGTPGRGDHRVRQHGHRHRSALKAGAFDYVQKPVDLEQLRGARRQGAETRRSRSTGRNDDTTDRSVERDATPARADQTPRPQSGADLRQRRIGQRQRTRCAADSRTRTARGRTVRAGELRRYSIGVDGERILRPQKRQLHRRGR